MIVYCFIPARHGSKRVPNKNFRILGCKPLIAHSIDYSLSSSCIAHTFVSTDSPPVCEIAANYPITVINRPSYLCKDESSTFSAVLHFLEFLRNSNFAFPDFVVLLQPSVPFREPGLIESTLDIISHFQFDSVCTYIPVDFFHPNKLKVPSGRSLHPYSEPERFDVSVKDLPTVLCRDGSIYTFKPETLSKYQNLLGENQGYVLNDPSHYVNIDTERDWLLAEQLAKCST